MAPNRDEKYGGFRFAVHATPNVGMEACEILPLFGSQFGVAHIRQLLEAGMSLRTIRRETSRGAWSAVLRGVVRLAGAEDTFESRAMSLILYAGPQSFLSGTTAAALWGLRNMPRARVEVTIRRLGRFEGPEWAHLVGSSWFDPERDVETRPDGLRVASPLRMLFGLASEFNEHRFERAAEDAWHLGLVTPTAAADYLEQIRRRGRGGVERFDEWLEKTASRSRPSQSGLELDLVDLIRRAGLPEPERQFALRLRSGVTIHLDLAWPDARLAVEPGHSWWHGGDHRQRADQARDRECDEVGWRVVRYDESVREDPAGYGQQLARIYRDRVRRLRA